MLSAGHFIFVVQMKVREFAERCEVAQALLVRRAEFRGDRLEVILGDRTGTVPAVIAPAAGEACRAGAVVFVTGTMSGSRLVVDHVREAADDEYAAEDLFDGPSRGLRQMESDLRELLATVQNPHLRQLLSAVPSFCRTSGLARALTKRHRHPPSSRRCMRASKRSLKILMVCASTRLFRHKWFSSTKP